MSDTLIKFSNAIITEAEEQKNKLLNKINSDNKALLESKKAELKKKKEHLISSETFKIENEAKTVLSSQSIKLKYELIKKREALIFNMFDKIKSYLSEYTKTDAYIKKLKTDFTEAIKDFNEDDTIVSARECDISLLKTLSGEKNISFKIADEESLGGFTITSQKMRIFIDATLSSKLEEEKTYFAESSGFILD